MNTATANASRDHQHLLRRSLQANGVFSTLCGIVFAVQSKPVADAIGLQYPWIILAIGVGLLIFAAGLFRNAARENINHVEALVALIGDFAWVIASGIVVLLGILNTTGNWAVAIVADGVLAFAILQWIGVRRMMKN